MTATNLDLPLSEKENSRLGTISDVDSFENLDNSINNNALQSNPVEKVIATIWAEVLNLDEFSVLEIFFEAGDSLLATRVNTRIQEVFGINIPLRHIFDAPTVVEFSKLISELPDIGEKVKKVSKVLIEMSELSDEETEALLMKKGE
ncbi:phosphopantetheine-binding protein [Bacillus pretiosus]|uniref:phosphopantetheine-binding protein n=1 Tax=Bacillus pretiosus TaxID=2983392 RepID=UPI003D662DFA